MSHPDLDRLTAWVHGLLELDDAAGVDAHVAACADCRETADEIQEEGALIAREIAPPERLDALKSRILAGAGRRPNRGLFWQVPVAAAVLIGLLAVLLSPRSRHSLVEGRMALEDGRVFVAPSDIPADRTVQLKAVDKSQLRLTDRSTVDLAPGSTLVLSPSGARGFTPLLASGDATISVAADPIRLRFASPAGLVEAADGRFAMKIVLDEQGELPMNKALAGAIVTVFAGSMSLSTEHGRAEAQPGQSAVLAAAESPLFLASPQDKQEDLLKRLEQLAARVAKLEDEVARLESKNKQLKAQLTSNGPGGPGGAVWSVNPGQSTNGVRVIQSAGGSAPGAQVVIELTEEDEKKVQELRKAELQLQKNERKEK